MAAVGDADYWSYARRVVGRKDVGHKCKECKQTFNALNEPMVCRRGGRIELKYHSECFSGSADPRTQSESSFNKGAWAGSQPAAAPAGHYRKMKTSSHW